MKRAGFTMIELIFVIVILGILAAVALPKFIGVSDTANAGKCEALVGTLNRTVLPTLWADMATNGTAATTAITATTLGAQITVPSECGTAGQYAAAANAGTGFVITVGDSTFDVNGTAATATVSPIITWTKQ